MTTPAQQHDAVVAARDIKARYVRLIDTRQWDEWAELFAPDAVLDASEDMATHGFPPEYGVVRGRTRILAGSQRALDGTRSVHQASEIAIEVERFDLVHATWAMTDRIEYPDGRILEGAGVYHDEYGQNDGRWEILHSRLERSSLDWTVPPSV